MTGEEAYKILSKSFPLARVRGCLDYGKFFAFSLAPIYVSDDQEYITGTTLTAVDKKTGRVFDYDITSDIRAYERAKKVEVKTIFDKTI